MQVDNPKLEEFRRSADRPNPRQTWAEFDAQLEKELRLMGTFFIHLEPGSMGLGHPCTEANILDPMTVSAVLGKDGQPEHYVVRHDPPRWFMTPREWMARPLVVVYCNWCADPHHPSSEHLREAARITGVPQNPHPGPPRVGCAIPRSRESTTACGGARSSRGRYPFCWRIPKRTTPTVVEDKDHA